VLKVDTESQSRVTFLFTRSLRLLNKRDYDRVFQSAKKVGSRSFLVLFRDNQQEHPRLGLVVAKKTAKPSHERHRFKRLVRESFRLNQHFLPHLDFVVLSRHGFEHLTNDDLFKELAWAWKRVIKEYSLCLES